MKRAYDYLNRDDDDEAGRGNGDAIGGSGDNSEDGDGENVSSYGIIKKVRSTDNGNLKIMRKAMRLFFKLVAHESISEFLKRDVCCLISDKVNKITKILLFDKS